jgi:hypothetical protein
MGDIGEPCWRTSFSLEYCAAIASDPDGGLVEAGCGGNA